MLFNSFAVLALVGCAQAEWQWERSSWHITGPRAQIHSLAAVYNSQVSEFAATVTTGSEYKSAKSELDLYLATRTGVPSIVRNTAIAAVTTYTTKPDWWDAMPSGAKDYFEKQIVVAEDRVEAIRDKVDVNDASRPLGLGLYASGVLVGAVAGLAMML